MSEEIKETGSAAPAQNTASENSAPEKSAEETKSTASESHNNSNRNEGRNDSRDSRDSRPRQSDGGDRRQRFPRFKKKVCKFCHNSELPIDYKRPDILVRFLTDRGKILPRRITGTCAKHQRRVASEVKRARMIALLPFVEQ